MAAIKNNLSKLLLAILVIFFAVGTFNISRLSYAYLNFEPYFSFLETKQLSYRLTHWRISFYLHVFSSSLLLICGALQFVPFVLSRYRKAHKISGYIYMIILLVISGPSAMIMSLYANGGIAAQASFIILSTFWYVFTLISLYKVYQKDYIAHAHFLLRSFLLTCSALTLRLYAMILSYAHIEAMPREKYILIAWLSWVPNLLIAEWIIQSGLIKKIYGHIILTIVKKAE